MHEAIGKQLKENNITVGTNKKHKTQSSEVRTVLEMDRIKLGYVVGYRTAVITPIIRQ